MIISRVVDNEEQQQEINGNDCAKFSVLGWSVLRAYDYEIDPEPTWAVDMNNESDVITNSEWKPIFAKRVLWAGRGQELPGGNLFTISSTGVYSLDVQVKFTDLVNVEKIELALFKYVDGISDDYWFILRSTNVTPGTQEAQLTGYTQFDFREGEKYYLAVKLYGDSPSATIDGSDDYTAWGASWDSPLTGE